MSVDESLPSSEREVVESCIVDEVESVVKETQGIDLVTQMFKYDDLFDFKVQIRLTMFELKLLIWPSIPSTHKRCYSFLHKMGGFKP